MRVPSFLLVFTCCFTTVASGQIRQVPTDRWEGPEGLVLRPPNSTVASRYSEVLKKAIVLAEEADSDSLLILHRERIVFERYWNGKTRDDVQQMYSATKSPFAFIVGRAISKGYIKGLDQPLVEIVPELAGGGREALTFRNIMAMESGLEQSRDLDTEDAKEQRSQYEAGSRRSVVHKPFEWYHYNNAAYRLLFTALERASGKSIPELTREELFEPLGMHGAYWMELKSGDVHKGYQSIRMRPVDLLKIGIITMTGMGTWNKKTYLPDTFVKEIAVAPAPEANPSYGLFWHLNSGDHYLSYYESDRVEGRLLPGTPPDALINYGSRGQLVAAVPSLNLVWVRTGSNIPSTLWERDSFVAKLSAAIVSSVKE